MQHIRIHGPCKPNSRRLTLSSITPLLLVTAAGCVAPHTTMSRTHRYSEKHVGIAEVDLSNGDRLELTATTSITPGVEGSPVMVNVTARNKGKTALNYLNGDMGNHLSVQVQVNDAQDHEMPLTTYGHERFDPLGGSLLNGSLKPGELHTWTVNVSRCFKLQPGQLYTLAASFTVFPHTGEASDFMIAVGGLEFKMQSRQDNSSEKQEQKSLQRGG